MLNNRISKQPCTQPCLRNNGSFVDPGKVSVLQDDIKPKRSCFSCGHPVGYFAVFRYSIR